MSVKGWFRQLGRDSKRFFGRQLPQGAAKFGRQAGAAFKMMPQAFKDASKVYSDIEKATRGAGIPLVPDLFGFAGRATGAIGSGLSGKFGKAISEGRGAISDGKGLMAAAAASPAAAAFL